MFIGHFAVGFAAKKIAPRASLGTLFLSAQFLDLLWPVFLLLNIEQAKIDPGNTVLTPLNFSHYPFSHSLLAASAWGVLFGGIYFSFTRRSRESWILALCVPSHWVLDLVVHRPDLPLLPSGPKVGFGLWNIPAVSLSAESLLFAAALGMYLKTTRRKDRVGTWALVGLVSFLVAIWASGFLGPPPPDIRTVAVVGNAQWLLILWAYWIDRHRESLRA